MKCDPIRYHHRVPPESDSFWRLPWPQRGVGLVLALAVASYAFICGLVVLFDQVDATNGHGVGAWAVSLLGIAVSAAIGLALGASLLKGFADLRGVTDGSTWQFVLTSVPLTVVALVCVSFAAAVAD